MWNKQDKKPKKKTPAADTRTAEQKASLRRLLADLHARYPKALIVGHHDLNPQKACPCIDNVAKEYADLQPNVATRSSGTRIEESKQKK